MDAAFVLCGEGADLRDGGFHQGDDGLVVWGRTVLVASALDYFKGVE